MSLTTRRLVFCCTLQPDLPSTQGVVAVSSELRHWKSIGRSSDQMLKMCTGTMLLQLRHSIEEMKRTTAALVLWMSRVWLVESRHESLRMWCLGKFLSFRARDGWKIIDTQAVLLKLTRSNIPTSMFEGESGHHDVYLAAEGKSFGEGRTVAGGVAKKLVSNFFFFDTEMNYEVSTRPKSRPQRGAKNCQRQEASCKHAESRPIHIAVNDKTPERTFAE